MNARRHDAIENARGLWTDILAGLGLDKTFLRNRHMPCPLCKGVDRYRWDNRDGNGGYYCNQCGPGTGMTLLMKFHGWTFREACQRVDAFLGRNFTMEARAVPRKPPPAVHNDRDKRRHDIERVLREATTPDIVAEYLASRAIATVPDVLRGHVALGLYDENRKPLGKHEAVVAPIVDVNGDLQCAHRIYLCDPRVKKLMRPIDTVNGCAVRLYEAGDALGIAEGIETACSAYELFGIPTWSVITAGGIESFVVPPGISSLTIFADNDSSFAGQKAAFVAAAKLRDKVKVDVKVPEKPDTDWNDVLREARA
jgi:putative DNA primase/helicase